MYWPVPKDIRDSGLIYCDVQDKDVLQQKRNRFSVGEKRKLNLVCCFTQLAGAISIVVNYGFTSICQTLQKQAVYQDRPINYYILRLNAYYLFIAKNSKVNYTYHFIPANENVS